MTGSAVPQQDAELEWDCPDLFADAKSNCAAVEPESPPPPPPGPARYTFGAHVVTVVPPAPGAGGGQRDLGTWVWRSALVLARALAAAPAVAAGARVLELGAGAGLCGLLAGELGARQVVLTDCSFEVLGSLLPSVEHARGGGGGWGGARDKYQVRRHLWEHDLPRSPGAAPPRHYSDHTDCDFGEKGAPPALEAGTGFDLVLAADCLYFEPQVDPLLASIAARLAYGGVALVTVSVRRRAVYRRFVAEAAAAGLAVDEDSEACVDPQDAGYLTRNHAWMVARGAVRETAAAEEVRLIRLTALPP